MREQVADNAIRDAMVLLNQKDVEEWLPADWQRWGEFVIITKKSKSDALNMINAPFERFFYQVERYFDVSFTNEEKERLYHKPSTFNLRNYKMGSPQHSNFVENGLEAITGYVHMLHLLLYENFEKIELQRKGIVGLIKKNNQLEDEVARYRGASRRSLDGIADKQPVEDVPEEIEPPEPEIAAPVVKQDPVPEVVEQASFEKEVFKEDPEIDKKLEIEVLKERLKKKSKALKKLKLKLKKGK